ncbi:MAG: hypothetical protein ACLFRR_04925 [Spirochaetaceae bacterium]
MTRSRLTRIAVLLILLAGALAPVAGAQNGGRESAPEVSSEIEWLDGRLRLDVRLPLTEEQRIRPAAADAAARSVRDDVPRFLQQEAAALLVDSRYTLAEYYERSPDLALRVSRLSEELEPVQNRLTPDMRYAELGYRLDLFPSVTSLFVEHSRVRDLPRVISWRPTREFTGLLIYAKGELPVHGEDRTARVRPALFPDVYSHETAEVVMEPNRVRPEVLREQGAVAYATSVDDPVVTERVGTKPMRTLAVGVYGRYPTDPIISTSDAETFFAEEANGDLIREGRIVIIVEESVLD